MTIDFKAECKSAKKEVDRLCQNWRALLDIMPGMIFLIRGDFVIEYMNRSAKQKFGDLCQELCDKELQKVVNSGSRSLASDAREKCSNIKVETSLRGVDVECSLVPFAGYKGETLFMVLLRDITRDKRHEKEIRDFHSNIEMILEEKIARLRESEENRRQLSQQINALKSQLGHMQGADKMIGNGRKMKELREVVHQVAASDATILITGESGTGKELVANMIKENSKRADKPFLKINCNSINDSVLESDLFGHEKGAFTDAKCRKKGKFEIVDGGTIFLDEIGDISPKMQAALLRVLQNGEIIRVGGNEPIRVDVRIIAATNIDLAKAVEKKVFRLDLYYRLNIINIEIPPLRDRKGDIIDLVSYFIKHYRKVLSKEIDFVPQSVINRLLEHDWPGNVRELENLIQRAVLMSKGNMITEQDLFFTQNPTGPRQSRRQYDVDAKLGVVPLKDILAEFESDVISKALRRYRGSVMRASRELRIGKTALYEKMKRYDISAKAIKNRAVR